MALRRLVRKGLPVFKHKSSSPNHNIKVTNLFGVLQVASLKKSTQSSRELLKQERASLAAKTSPRLSPREHTQENAKRDASPLVEPLSPDEVSVLMSVSMSGDKGCR